MSKETKIETYLRSVVEPIVDKPEELKVTVAELPSMFAIELDPAQEDAGKIIGRHGGNFESIRRLVHAFCAKISRKAGRVYLSERFAVGRRSSRNKRRRPRSDQDQDRDFETTDDAPLVAITDDASRVD